MQWRKAAVDAGVRHVVWSTLEDTRDFVPLGSGRDAGADGQVQRAALRRQGRGQRARSSTAGCRRRCSTRRSTGTTSSTSACSRSAAPTAGCGFVLPMGDAKLPGIAAADIGPCAFGIFARGERARSASRSASPASTCPARRWRSSSRGRSASRSAHRDGAASNTRALGFPGADDLAQHVPVQARVRAQLLRLAQPRAARANCIRRCRPSRSGSRRTRPACRSNDAAPLNEFLAR